MTPAFPEPYRAGQSVILRSGERVGMVGRVLAALPTGWYALATAGYDRPTIVHHLDLVPAPTPSTPAARCRDVWWSVWWSITPRGVGQNWPFRVWNGSGGRIRTYDMAVNSRPLYH